MDENKIVALYVRVSTGYQIDRDSLPFQKKELKNYCKYTLHNSNYEIFEDAGKSGKNTDRPGFQRMIELIRSGRVSHVIVYKIDRISRNLVDFSVMYDEFKRNRVTFVSLNEQFDTSSAIGEAVLKIILVFAELERKMTSERVKAVMIGRAQGGKWNGARMPYGWKWNSEKELPEPDPTEAPNARLIYELYERTRSTSLVRNALIENNVPTKRGGIWTTHTLSEYIRNPINKGCYRYNFRESPYGKKKPADEVVLLENAFPALVDPDLWERCNAIMDGNAKKKNAVGVPHSRVYAHAFAGLLVCADCGARFQARKSDKMRANGFKPSLYQCGSRSKYLSCVAPGASDVVIGPVLFNFISHIVTASAHSADYKTPDALERLLLSGSEFSEVACMDPAGLNAIFDAIHGRRPSGSDNKYIPAPLQTVKVSPDLSGKRAEAAKLSRALERLKNAYLFDDDAMDEKEYLTTRSDLQERLTRINNQIADERTSDLAAAPELSFINSASAFLLSYRVQSGEHIVYSDLAAAVEPKVLQEFIRQIVDHIEIKSSRVSGITFKNGLDCKFIFK